MIQDSTGTIADDNAVCAITYNVGYDSVGHPVQLTGSGSTVYWQAGTGSVSTDPATGAYDALNRLTTTKWDTGLGMTTSNFYPNSNLPSGYAATLPGAGGTRFGVYSSQGMTWQGSLLTGYTVTSNWEGGGTSYAADYDTDGHLHDWSAAAMGSIGTATQQFNERYGFSLENMQSIVATNNLGLTKTLSYAYDSVQRERVTSIAVQAAGADYFDYDRRGRGLIIGHRISATQQPPQDGYEYDVDGRLISISKLGGKLEDLTYGPDGELVARQFTGGTDTARYYVGDHMTLVRRGTTTVGYAHIYLGATRLASVWSKSAGTTTTGTIYYHRNEQRSVVATTTAGGQVGISYRYLPSGAIDKTVGTEADENVSELGFTGGLKLSGGLIHLKARAYSPLLRRFLQPDTLDFRRYTYVRGDPVNFIDPSGRCTVSAPGINCKVDGGNPESSKNDGSQNGGSDGRTLGGGGSPPGSVNSCSQDGSGAWSCTEEMKASVPGGSSNGGNAAPLLPPGSLSGGSGAGYQSAAGAFGWQAIALKLIDAMRNDATPKFGFSSASYGCPRGVHSGFPGGPAALGGSLHCSPWAAEEVPAKVINFPRHLERPGQLPVPLAKQQFTAPRKPTIHPYED